MKMRGVFVLACVIMFAFGSPSQAQTLKFCSNGGSLTAKQGEFAGAIAFLGDKLDQYILYHGTEDVSFTSLLICAREVRTRVCTDQLIAGFLDPRSQVVTILGGALVGNALGSAEGGMAAAEAGGFVLSAIGVARCQKKVEEVYIPLFQKMGPFDIDLDRVSLAYFGQMVDVARRNQRLSAADAEKVMGFASQVAAEADRSL